MSSAVGRRVVLSYQSQRPDTGLGTRSRRSYHTCDNDAAHTRSVNRLPAFTLTQLQASTSGMVHQPPPVLKLHSHSPVRNQSIARVREVRVSASFAGHLPDDVVPAAE